MSKESLPTDEMIDDSDKFEAVYKSNERPIYRFMFWRTKDEMLAEDLTSSVFEKAWRTRRNFSGGSAKAWLYSIAHTTLIDHWRKKKEVSDDGYNLSQVLSDTDLAETMDQSLAAAELQQAVKQLPKDMQRVIQLRFIEGQSARQTATRLNISEGNVRVIQYRALQKLRDYLP